MTLVHACVASTFQSKGRGRDPEKTSRWRSAMGRGEGVSARLAWCAVASALVRESELTGEARWALSRLVITGLTIVYRLIASLMLAIRAFGD